MGGFNQQQFNQGTGGPSGCSLAVSDIIYRAFRIAGVLANAGRDFANTGGSYYTDAFNILNSMLDNWNTQRLNVYTINQVDQDLASGQQVYTIGPGGDWNMVRPSRIERANLVYISADPSAPLEIPMEILTIDGWKSIPQKNVPSIFPLQLYYDMGWNTSAGNPGFPGLGNVYVFPVPQAINIVRLWVWQLFSAFQNVTDCVSFPPGYRKAIEYNLARELAMQFPERAKMSAAAELEAYNALQEIKLLNVPMMDLSCDEALINRPGGMWNWRTGTYQGQPY